MFGSKFKDLLRSILRGITRIMSAAIVTTADNRIDCWQRYIFLSQMSDGSPCVGVLLEVESVLFCGKYCKYDQICNRNQRLFVLMASQKLHHNYELASRSWSGQEVWFWSSPQALLPQKLRGRGSLKYQSRLHQMVHNSWNLNVRSTRGVGMCLWNWPKTQSAKYGRCCRFGLPLGEVVFACLRKG